MCKEIDEFGAIVDEFQMSQTESKKLSVIRKMKRHYGCPGIFPHFRMDTRKFRKCQGEMLTMVTMMDGVMDCIERIQAVLEHHEPSKGLMDRVEGLQAMLDGFIGGSGLLSRIFLEAQSLLSHLLAESGIREKEEDDE